MDNLTLGFDDNLGLPQDFSEKTHLSLKSYHDLSLMLDDFANGGLSCLFLPAGALPFVKVQYQFVAQATHGVERARCLTACLASAKFSILPALSTINFGRINAFCTTSFWALLLYFMDKTEAGTTLHFSEVNGFHDLLIQTAAQTVDAAMIWDALFNTYPEDVGNVFTLDEMKSLPTPVIISQVTLSSELKAQLNDFKFQDELGFFNGFSAVDGGGVEDFLDKIKLARAHFKCVSD